MSVDVLAMIATTMLRMPKMKAPKTSRSTAATMATTTDEVVEYSGRARMDSRNAFTFAGFADSVRAE